MGKKLINPLLEVVNKQSMLINPYIYSELDPNKIYITFNPTTNFQVSLLFTFASGSITIDWKDGSVPQNFTTNVYLTHIYAVAGNYVKAEISGNVENITQFKADSSRIKAVSNFKSGVLTTIELRSNVLSGVVDFSKAKFSSNIQIFINSASTTTPTEIIMPDEYVGVSRVNRIRAYATRFTKWDFKSVGIYNEMWLHSNPSLQSIKLSSINNLAVFEFYVYSCGNFSFDFNGATGLLSGNNCNWRFENNTWPAATVNKFLYDCNVIAPSGYTGRVINVGGTNADPDSSSGGYDGLAAKTGLESKGFTVNIT